MKMNETRVLIREKRLERYSRILSKRYDIDLKLSPSKNMIGCCDSSKKIWISSNLSDDTKRNLILQKAVTLHEIGHILYTKSNSWQRINRNIANIISDGRVEEAMARMLPKARWYFVYANRVIFDKEVKFDQNCFDRTLGDMLLRFAKKRTGIPPISKPVISQIVSVIGKENYDYFQSKVREAVDAKTEDEAASITREIESRFYSIGRELTENVAKTEQKSIERASSMARQMPKETDDEIAELLDSQDDTSEPEQVENSEQENEPEDIDEPETDDDIFDINTITKNEEDDTTGIPEDVTDDISDLVEDLSDSLDSLNSDIEVIDDKIDSVMNQIEDTISSEAEEEIRNENDIIKSKEADADFPDYDIDKENDSKFKPKTEYGSYVRHVDNIKLENQSQKLARQFKVIAEKGDGWLHNQKRGKIDMHQINRLFNNNNKQPAIFRKKTQIEGVDLAVSILLDSSGSMRNDRYIATDIAYVLSRGLELGKYKSEVIQFGTATMFSGYSADCRGVKSFNQKTQYAIKRFLPAAEGYTPLLKALEGAEKSLLKQSARRKVVFVVTDGQPYDPTIEESEYAADCKKKVAMMQKKGYIVVGIGIHSSDHFNIFEHFIRCRTVNETEKAMIGVIKEILRKL